jgi:hypothetical protein
MDADGTAPMRQSRIVLSAHRVCPMWRSPAPGRLICCSGESSRYVRRIAGEVCESQNITTAQRKYGRGLRNLRSLESSAQSDGLGQAANALRPGGRQSGSSRAVEHAPCLSVVIHPVGAARTGRCPCYQRYKSHRLQEPCTRRFRRPYRSDAMDLRRIGTRCPDPDPSSLPLASQVPSGAIATALTAFVWPVGWRGRCRRRPRSGSCARRRVR